MQAFIYTNHIPDWVLENDFVFIAQKRVITKLGIIENFKVKVIHILEYPIICKETIDLRLHPLSKMEFELLKEYIFSTNGIIESLAFSFIDDFNVKQINAYNWIDHYHTYSTITAFQKYYLDYLLPVLFGKKNVLKHCIGICDSSKITLDYVVFKKNKAMIIHSQNVDVDYILYKNEIIEEDACFTILYDMKSLYFDEIVQFESIHSSNIKSISKRLNKLF